jgi:hypothetical protein
MVSHFVCSAEQAQKIRTTAAKEERFRVISFALTFCCGVGYLWRPEFDTGGAADGSFFRHAAARIFMRPEGKLRSARAKQRAERGHSSGRSKSPAPPPGEVLTWAEVSRTHRIRSGVHQRGGRLVSLLTDFGRIDPCDEVIPSSSPTVKEGVKIRTRASTKVGARASTMRGSPLGTCASAGRKPDAA